MDGLGKWFRGLRGRLLLMVIIPVCIVAATVVFALVNFKTQQEATTLIARDRLPKITSLLRLRVDAESAVRSLWAGIGFTDMEIRKQKLAASQKSMQDFKAEYEHLNAMKLVEASRVPLNAMYEEWKKIDAYAKDIYANLLAGNPAQEKIAREILETKFLPVYLKQLEAIQNVETIISGQVDLVVVAGEKTAEQIRSIMLIFGIISTAVLFLIGIFIANYLGKSLSHISSQVNAAGTQTTAASRQLNAASQTLSSGSMESAASLEETVSSLEELSSIVKLNAANAKEAANLAQESTKSAENGEAEINNLTSAMAEIIQSSKKIEEIINVIDDIAFQTNLLALNAAVEAARAGEQGKGFAVVAEAVRNLAMQSAVAAKDINTLIKESVIKTDRGAKIANQSSTVLKNIVTSVKKVSDLNNEIATANAEQSEGISQISKAMNELDSATQGNASAAEEVAASSEELSAQATLLQGMVRDLVKIVEGVEQGNQDSGPTDERRYSSGKGGEFHAERNRSKKPFTMKQGGIVKVSGDSSSIIPFDNDPPKAVGSLDGF